MWWVITFVMVQLIIAVTVVLVLRKLLEKELIEAALERLEYFKPVQGGECIVRFASQLDVQVENRFKSWCSRKCAGSSLCFEQDGALKGGVMIIFGNETLDFSLANRLKNFWS